MLEPRLKPSKLPEKLATPTEWVCDGICESVSVTEAAPPESPTLYSEPPAPTTNLFLKSGVLLLPSHKTYPEGIAFAAPDHITITPVGIPAIPVRFDPSIAGKAPVSFEEDIPDAILALVTALSAILSVIIASLAITDDVSPPEVMRDAEIVPVAIFAFVI